MNAKYFLAILCCVLFCAACCGDDYTRSIAAENSTLTDENRTLKSRIQELELECECDIPSSSASSSSKKPLIKLGWINDRRLPSSKKSSEPTSKKSSKKPSKRPKKPRKNPRPSTVKISQEQRAKTIKKAMHSLKKKHDINTHTTWYFAGNSPFEQFKNGLFIYIGTQTNRKPWLRLRTQYYSKKALNLKAYSLTIDGYPSQQRRVTFKHRQKGKNSLEWTDHALSTDDLKLLQEVINARTVTVTLIGENYSDTFELKSRNISAIKQLLKTYNLVKNERNLH